MSKSLALLPLILITLAGCSKPGEKRDAPVADSGQPKVEIVDKAWWTNRVAQALSNGKSSTTPSDLDALAKNSPDEIIDTLMAKDEFTEALISFNLDYLGFRSDDIRYPDGTLFSTFKSVAQFPPAVTSALTVRADGDFFSILDADQPVYASPLSTAPLITPDTPDTRTMAEQRAATFVKHRQMFAELKTFIASTPTPRFDEVCSKFFEKVDFEGLINIGLPFDFLNDISKLLGPLGRACNDFDAKGANAADLVAASVKHWDDLEVYLKDFDSETYKVTSAQAFKTYDVTKLGFADEAHRSATEQEFSTMWFWKAMINSSTNFDRKRSSYVLKRFFCDDLTPIAVETPANHAEGKHASDPSCQACHYKLDPIAGFFRYNGINGKDFSAENQLTFDDGAQVDMQSYLKSWLGADGKPNIGYIRSVNDNALNDLGPHPENPTLQDLFAIIKTAPEAQQCLVKSVFRYFVGEQIALDAGYLEYLSGKFNEDMTARGSGVALKATIKRVLTSNSFTETNPVESVCYDYAPGVDPKGMPPCKVARILEKNCASCHNASSASGGLNLATWQRQGDERLGFNLAGGGDSKATFQVILDRLSATDEEIRMPFKQHMATADRETLYLWVTEQLAAKGVEK